MTGPRLPSWLIGERRPHRLRRRICRRPHRRAAAVVAELARSPGRVPDLRDLGRAHAGARPSSRADATGAGYEPLLERPAAAGAAAPASRNGIRIVSNFGGRQSPPAPAAASAGSPLELGLPAPRIAVVEGDDLSAGRLGRGASLRGRSLGTRLSDEAPAVVSANAYLGAEGPSPTRCVAGADSWSPGGSPTRRCVSARRWPMSSAGRRDDWDRLAPAPRMAGHLLECGAQVTGGYYADPGVKDVPGLAGRLSRRRDIDADGTLSAHHQAARHRRLVDAHTSTSSCSTRCTIPPAYVTPDVVLDSSEAEVTELRPGPRARSPACAATRGPTAEGRRLHRAAAGWPRREISYAGAQCARPARACAECRHGANARRAPDSRCASTYRRDSCLPTRWPPTRRRRAAAVRTCACASRRKPRGPRAGRAPAREVDALYTTGPAGGGGVRTSLQPRLGQRVVPHRARAPSRRAVSFLVGDAA